MPTPSGEAVQVCCLLPGEADFTVATAVPSRPLGTVLLLPPTDHQLVLYAEAVRVWRTSPWCPLLLVMSHAVQYPAVTDFAPLGMQPTILMGDSRPSADVARTTIHGRPPPNSGSIAGYFAARHAVRFGELYAAIIEGSRVSAVLRRALREYGSWTPHDIIALDRGVKLIAAATRGQWTEAYAATAAGLDVKTVSSLCRRYFGWSWRQLVGLGAWEAVLELALRCRAKTDQEHGPMSGGCKQTGREFPLPARFRDGAVPREP